MYEVVSRERVSGFRPSRYVVEFSLPWPEGASRVYLVSDFHTWLPGAVRLRRSGDRGVVRVRLWEGVYRYAFIIDSHSMILDPENPSTELYRPLYESTHTMRVSVADVGYSRALSAVREGGGPHWEYVVHDEREPCYASTYLGHLVLRLRTLRGEFDEAWVELLLGGERLEHPMSRMLTTELFDYYEAVIPLKGRRGQVAYCFKLYEGSRAYAYGDKGPGDDEPIRPRDVLVVDEPPWFLGALYYLVFVDSFDNADPSNDPPERIGRLTPREHGYYGGDLKGVTRRLDHIAGLGVDVVYLTPVFKATSYHRYDVVDYLEVDPYLGGDEALDELLNEAHRRGLRLILDVPLHHTSPCFHAFVDAVRRGRESPYWDWYLFLVDEIPPEARSLILKYVEAEYFNPQEMDERLRGLLRGELLYETFLNVLHMPRLNHENPDVLNYFTRVLRYWLERGVDGFRLDVSHAIPVEFLRSLYEAVKRARGDALVMGEVVWSPDNHMSQGCYDTVMNYELRRLILQFVVDEVIDAQVMACKLMEMYLGLPPVHANSLYNLLGSHDTPRILTYAGGDKRKVLLAYTLLYLVYGSPSIYYGDEVGMEGGEDPDCRRPMAWDESLWDHEIYELLRWLGRLRRDHEVFRYGLFRAEAVGQRQLHVTRYLDGVEGHAVVNASPRPFKCSLRGLRGEVSVLRGAASLGDVVEVEVPPYGATILVAHAPTR